MKVRKLQGKRAITFPTFCRFCDRNGANHQEYGRLCPSKDECLLTHKAKSEKSCPRWNRLRVAYSIEQVEDESNGAVDRIRDGMRLHIDGELET